MIFFHIPPYYRFFFFFFLNDTATPEIYTLSLHDALPISSGLDYVRGMCPPGWNASPSLLRAMAELDFDFVASARDLKRSEEHTSELQSHVNLVCRLLLEKKKKHINKLIFLHSEYAL